jgi:hypothetical protein
VVEIANIADGSNMAAFRELRSRVNFIAECWTA